MIVLAADSATQSSPFGEIVEHTTGRDWNHVEINEVPNLSLSFLYEQAMAIRGHRALASARRAGAPPSLTTTSLPTAQKRRIQDVAITRTGKPIIRVQGGR